MKRARHPPPLRGSRLNGGPKAFSVPAGDHGGSAHSVDRRRAGSSTRTELRAYSASRACCTGACSDSARLIARGDAYASPSSRPASSGQERQHRQPQRRVKVLALELDVVLFGDLGRGVAEALADLLDRNISFRGARALRRARAAVPRDGRLAVVVHELRRLARRPPQIADVLLLEAAPVVRARPLGRLRRHEQEIVRTRTLKAPTRDVHLERVRDVDRRRRLLHLADAAPVFLERVRVAVAHGEEALRDGVEVAQAEPTHHP